MPQDPLWSQILITVFTGVLLAGALALFAGLLPLHRWRRALQRDVAILSGLPPGPERDKWEALVEEQAARVRKNQGVRKWWPIFVVPVFLASAGSITYFFFNVYDFYPELEFLSGADFQNLSESEQEQLEEIEANPLDVRIWGLGILISIAFGSLLILTLYLSDWWESVFNKDEDD